MEVRMPEQTRLCAMLIATPATSALTSLSTQETSMSTVLVHSSTRAVSRGDALHTSAVVIGLVALMLVALAAPRARGQSSDGELKDVPIDELKSVYLSCNGTVMGGQSNSAEIALCSVVYEELKQRAFSGDFEKLLAWSRGNSSVQNTGR
jgi:hypothetical protein